MLKLIIHPSQLLLNFEMKSLSESIKTTAVSSAKNSRSFDSQQREENASGIISTMGRST